MRSWRSLTVSDLFFFFLSHFIFHSPLILLPAALELGLIRYRCWFFSVNGQTAAGKADAPAAGQTETGEAEDDSDDDKEEGAGAPEAGASGGMLRSHFFYLPLLRTTSARANKRTLKSYSRKEEEEAQAQEEEGRRQGPKLPSPRSGVESLPQRIPRR